MSDEHLIGMLRGAAPRRARRHRPTRRSRRPLFSGDACAADAKPPPPSAPALHGQHGFVALLSLVGPNGQTVVQGAAPAARPAPSATSQFVDPKTLMQRAASEPLLELTRTHLGAALGLVLPFAHVSRFCQLVPGRRRARPWRRAAPADTQMIPGHGRVSGLAPAAQSSSDCPTEAPDASSVCGIQCIDGRTDPYRGRAVTLMRYFVGETRWPTPPTLRMAGSRTWPSGWRRRRTSDDRQVESNDPPAADTRGPERGPDLGWMPGSTSSPLPSPTTAMQEEPKLSAAHIATAAGDPRPEPPRPRSVCRDAPLSRRSRSRSVPRCPGGDRTEHGGAVAAQPTPSQPASLRGYPAVALLVAQNAASVRLRARRGPDAHQWLPSTVGSRRGRHEPTCAINKYRCERARHSDEPAVSIRLTLPGGTSAQTISLAASGRDIAGAASRATRLKVTA